MSYCRYIDDLSKEMHLALAVDAVCRIVGKNGESQIGFGSEEEESRQTYVDSLVFVLVSTRTPISIKCGL